MWKAQWAGDNSLAGAKLLGASFAQGCRASSVAFACGPVGNEADVARSAFCSLATAAGLDAASRPRAADD